MTTPNRPLASEEVYGEKWDRCMTDTMVKAASGLALGIVFSAVLFKRRPWPVFLGTGIGLGMGYGNCQNDFRSPYVHSQPLTLAKAHEHILTKSSNSG
ncbi:unnamed protein product [Adineta steineri]|uniref:MICOS complex subunit MIC10 n=1 Tax=Adineta steineri TaxID=433720 RepID=A0A813T937_9BILA|nr:unnamed protein product [Adineta steineri]CAF0805715.1 unnamed protein product [Adineta steineri]CAF0865648.1 unnamed protein product [Adineta steineri]CAF0874996.1 unnamed protein product [Adineta steineri]CAF0938641.1 unnamed protein product [Adineta steineri]